MPCWVERSQPTLDRSSKLTAGAFSAQVNACTLVPSADSESGCRLSQACRPLILSEAPFVYCTVYPD